MTLILAYKNLGLTRLIVIKDADGIIITPGVDDKIRAIIGREGEPPRLTVTSDGATANGSSFTKGATNTLRLDASDLCFEPGVYTMFIDFYDMADEAEWKNVERQIFSMEQT